MNARIFTGSPVKELPLLSAASAWFSCARVAVGLLYQDPGSVSRFACEIFFPPFWIVVAELLCTHLKAVVVPSFSCFFFSFHFFSTNKSLVVTYYLFLLCYVPVVPTYLLPGSRCKSAKVGSSSPVSRDSAARRKVLFINFIICLDFWRFPLISSPRYTLTMFLIGSDSCWHLQCRKNTNPPATLSSSTMGNLIRFLQKVVVINTRYAMLDFRFFLFSSVFFSLGIIEN